MTGSDTLLSVDIVPVHCPQCGEAQNTLEGAADPLSPEAHVGCMVCGHRFDAVEYRRLLNERHAELKLLKVKTD